MKIIYVGNCNSFASNLVDRCEKEDNQIYLISEDDFIKANKPILKYKQYRYREDDMGLEKIFSSIMPDIVVFAGRIFMRAVWEYDSLTNDYLPGLLNILNLSLKHNVRKFIYLSSVEVYPADEEVCTESTKKQPSTYKGQLCSCGEELVTGFYKNNRIDATILRMGDIYGCSLKEEQKDFLTNLAQEFYKKENISVNPNKYDNPVYIKDCVDAVIRTMNSTPTYLYNVSGPEAVREIHIAKLIGIHLKMEDKLQESDGTVICRNIDTSRIKNDLEWVCYHGFESSFQNNEIDFTRETVKNSSKKLKTPAKKAVPTIENLLVFLLFAMLSYLFQNISALHSVNPMLIYIVLMALVLGTRQTVLSIVLATAAYIWNQNGFKNLNSLNILGSIDFIITIAQYIFMGMVVGYTVEHNHVMIREKENENEFLNNELKEIQEINEDNIKIKQEYEKRILSNKTSLPKLYSIISRLTVLEPEKIFTEAIDVVKDIMDTDTVAVYLANEKNSYIRLIASSGTDAVFQGKSINLDQFPKMREMLYKNELFIGSQWNDNEPSLAAPIFYEQKCIAVILINKMKFSGLNLYQMNLFRTLAVLIASSVVKAKEYENAVRSKQYIDDTDILNENEFKKLVFIKKEGREKGIADYCILKLTGIGTRKEIYYRVVNYARNTDFFGTNGKQELFVLLSNTTADEMPYVRERFRKVGIDTEVESM